jgi:hypothetical protein
VGISPLDEELGLLPGRLSPRLQESLARLGAWLPFGKAAAELAWFSGVAVSEATACRLTEAAGAADVAIQTAEVERLERELPDPPGGPAVQQLSADGAMVPLVGGVWAEVKTVAIGTVVAEPGADPAGPPRVHTEALSYCSRLTDSETFARLATAELHRRGTATAGVVVGVQDGAAWLQGFLDYHRPDAVRILDFPHALQALSTAAQATFGVGTAAAAAWREAQADALQGGAPSAVLVALLELPTATATNPAAAAAARDETFGYLAKRLDQLRYADFVARGYPIGSGVVESANKLVVEARLKGSGMHWAAAHVDPLLALRTIVCSDRWAEAWPQIGDQLRRQGRARQAARRAARRPAPPPPPEPVAPPPPRPRPPARSTARPKLLVSGRPTPEHPWKRRPCLLGPRRPTPTAKP